MSSIYPSVGDQNSFLGVDNETAKVLNDQLMQLKNAQNLKQTKDGIDLDYSTKLMQQIGQAKA